MFIREWQEPDFMFATRSKLNRQKIFGRIMSKHATVGLETLYACNKLEM